MLGGDISNEVMSMPRVIVVWEGFMSSLPHSRKAWALTKSRAWQKLIPEYLPNQLVIDAMSQFAVWSQVKFDVMTFLPQPAATHIDDWCDDHMASHGPVEATTALELARLLAYRPLVQTVCDPDAMRSLMYGSKGLHVSPTNPRFWR